MSFNRRQFVAGAGVSVATVSLFNGRKANGAVASVPGQATTTEENVAEIWAPAFMAYALTTDAADINTWVQIDLGSSQPLDAILLYPGRADLLWDGGRFPQRFKLETADDAAFKAPRL